MYGVKQMTGVRLLFASLILFIFAATGYAGEVYIKPPSNPDPNSKFLFYMHGRFLEKNKNTAVYQYPEILKSFAGSGFSVIGEIRKSAEFAPNIYARRIFDQVNQLISRGVPASNITVAGHSKGGILTMVASSLIQRDDMRFAVLASCAYTGKQVNSYNRFIRSRAKQMRGIFLIMWEKSDKGFADCNKAMEVSGVPFRNIRLSNGGGHRLFYQPKMSWMRPLIKFALGRNNSFQKSPIR